MGASDANLSMTSLRLGNDSHSTWAGESSSPLTCLECMDTCTPDVNNVSKKALQFFSNGCLIDNCTFILIAWHVPGHRKTHCFLWQYTLCKFNMWAWSYSGYLKWVTTAFVLLYNCTVFVLLYGSIIKRSIYICVCLCVCEMSNFI